MMKGHVFHAGYEESKRVWAILSRGWLGTGIPLKYTIEINMEPKIEVLEHDFPFQLGDV